MCVFIHGRRDPQFKNDRFVRTFFLDNFILLSRVFARRLLRGGRQSKIFHLFWVWGWTMSYISEVSNDYYKRWVALNHTHNLWYSDAFTLILISWNPSTYTYIIGHYNPSVRIIDLVSHTTYVVCVNFIHKWRDLQLKVDSERQIFWETFHGNFIYSQSFCQKSAERKSPKKYFSHFILMSGLGLEPWLFV